MTVVSSLLYNKSVLRATLMQIILITSVPLGWKYAEIVDTIDDDDEVECKRYGY